jgi:hypothetical protein
MQTRFSSVLISFKIPMIIASSSFWFKLSRVLAMFQTTVGFETIVILLEQEVCQLYAVMKNTKYENSKCRSSAKRPELNSN